MKSAWNRFGTAAAAVGAFLGGWAGGPALGAESGVKAEERPLIQVALLLDTSGSMDGLIEQAKAQLWKVVNEFALAKREGMRPELRVSLFHYGNSGLPAGEGYIRMLLPLTNDLDKVSQELFALRTNGGEEYCGQVIRDAVEKLDWSRRPGDYKAIFIAGNEPFTQGTVDYRKSCAAAAAKGIVVNTIFCGPHAEGISTNWQDGARLADGSYMSIDQNRAVVHVDAPQDAELLKLNEALNGTYIAYGAKGKEGQRSQFAMDKAAQAEAVEVLAQRAEAKAGGLYQNARWDLVDAAQQGQVKLDDVKEKDLPEEMRKMSADERKTFVEGKTKERQKVQERMKALGAEREKFVTEELKKRGQGKNDTLDAAMIKAVREQAAKKQYTFDGK